MKIHNNRYFTFNYSCLKIIFILYIKDTGIVSEKITNTSYAYIFLNHLHILHRIEQILNIGSLITYIYIYIYIYKVTLIIFKTIKWFKKTSDNNDIPVTLLWRALQIWNGPPSEGSGTRADNNWWRFMTVIQSHVITMIIIYF